MITFENIIEKVAEICKYSKIKGFVMLLDDTWNPLQVKILFQIIEIYVQCCIHNPIMKTFQSCC